MNRKDNDARYGNIFQLEKGNQIASDEQGATIWIEISESELPEGISNQDILRISEYRQVNDYGITNDVTIIEESFVQSTEISANAIQTDYVIDDHKYSKELIKPYFLNYFNLKDTPSEESIESIHDYLGVELLKQFTEQYCETNSLIKADAGISTIPTFSQHPFDYYPDNFFALTPRYITRKDKETTLQEEIFVSKRDSSEILYLSNKDWNISECTTPDNSVSSWNICTELVESLIVNPVKELIFPNHNMSLPPDDCPSTHGFPPVELLACHKKPPPEPEPPPEPSSDDVYVMCMKDDVRFKLRCRKVGGSDSHDNLGDETRYECEVVPDPNLKIDKAILESCDLRCKLCDNKSPDITPYNVHYNRKDDKPDPSVMTTTMKTDSVMRIVIKTDCGKTKSSTSNSSSSSGGKGSKSSKCKSKDPSDNGIKVCPPPCNGPCLDNSKLRYPEYETEDSKKGCQATTIIIYQETPGKNDCTKENKANAKKPEPVKPEAKKIPETKSAATVKPEKDPCPPNVFDEITSAMLQAHNRTVATIKCAAEEFMACNTKHPPPNPDQGCLETLKQKVQDAMCNIKQKADSGELQKSAENLYSCGKETFKEAAKFTRETVNEARIQSKKIIGVDTNEDDNCKPPPRKCSYEDNRSLYSENESNSSSELFEDLRKKSVEHFYDTVCRTAQEVADIASNSITIFGLEPNRPPRRTQQQKRHTVYNPADRPKYSAEKLIYDPITSKKTANDIAAEDRMDQIRLKAGKLCESMRQTAINLKESTADTCSDIASTAGKIFKNEDQILQQKSQNIKRMLSGFMIFEDKFKDKEEGAHMENIPQSKIARGVTSIKESVKSLGKIDIPDKSSAYDIPAKPVELLHDPGGVSGMFASIKDKIYSIFYEREHYKRPDNFSSYSNSSTDSEDDKSVKGHSTD